MVGPIYREGEAPAEPAEEKARQEARPPWLFFILYCTQKHYLHNPLFPQKVMDSSLLLRALPEDTRNWILNRGAGGWPVDRPQHCSAT
jgi:hypothetical protein